MQLKPLGELESLVMGILWSAPALTVREVCDRQDRGRVRAYTTLMTTMDRLFHKGLLTRRKDGLAWRYRPAIARADFEHALADQLAVEIVQVHGDVGLAAFVEAASADPAMLDRLDALITARRGES
jgi:predicted transcriptional regulator